MNLGEALYRRFVSIYAGNDIPNKKPHPEVYLRCLADMGLPAAAVVALEDTRIGMLSALAAGLTTVVTYTHWTDDQDFAGAAMVVDHLGEPGGPASRASRGPSLDAAPSVWMNWKRARRREGSAHFFFFISAGISTSASTAGNT